MQSFQTSEYITRKSVQTTAARLKRGLRYTLSELLHAMLPSVCLCCGGQSSNELKALCELCARSFLASGTSTSGNKPDSNRSSVDVHCMRCARCGLAFPGNACSDQHIAQREMQCGQCLSDPPAFDDSLVVTDYAPPLDRLIQDLKFRSRLPLARAFGVLLTRVAVNASDNPSFTRLANADLILPVPLSSARLAQRGFNQAMEIARPVARVMKLPLASDLCIRVRDTRAQTELPLSQRRVNMRGAFAIRQRAAIEGRHIVVIDDVMTTGHTLGELAACLKRHGAARVSNLVLARTPMR